MNRTPTTARHGAAAWQAARAGASASALFLASCATVPQIQTVKVPVPVECREKVPTRPAMPTDGLDVADSLLAKVKALLAEIELRQGYEDQLQAALGNCTRPVGPTEGGRRGQ